MYFDGSVAKVGAGAGVYIISPIHDFKALSYKLLFECTNNVAEYEALLLGLHALIWGLRGSGSWEIPSW